MLVKSEEAHLRAPRGRLVPRVRLGFWISLSIGTLLLAVLVRTFVFETFTVTSSSMAPALIVGDRVLAYKLAYGIYLPWRDELVSFDSPKAGDVVIVLRFSEFEARDESRHYVKRVVAVPGDLVEVEDGLTLVNGEPVYRNSAPGSNLDTLDYGPIKLGDKQYFLLGDNSPNSRDSRFYGPISQDDIQAKVWLIYWSRGLEGAKKIWWRRIGRWVN